jgi:hypothetical protein
MKSISGANTTQTNRTAPSKTVVVKTDNKPTVDALVEKNIQRWRNIPQVDKIDEHTQEWLKQAKPNEAENTEANEKPLTDETVKKAINAYKKDPEKQLNPLLNILKSGMDSALKKGNLYNRNLDNLNRFQQTVIPTGAKSYVAIEQSAGSETFNTAPESVISVARFKNNQILEHAGFLADKSIENKPVKAVDFKTYNTSKEGDYKFEKLHWNKHELLKKYRSEKAQPLQ